MTATIRRSARDRARHRQPRRGTARFSFMESLGFIESPATVSRSWVPADPIPMEPAAAPVKRGAHERTVADLDPIDTTRELFRRDIRWGLVITVAMMLLGLVMVASWVWQRPAVMAEQAASDLAAAATTLTPELETLQEVNDSLTTPDLDASAVSVAALAVDARARALFNASAALPATQSLTRTEASDAATKALDASRLLSDASAYRGAVIQILVAPALETDPGLIALDDAVRQIGTWRLGFDQVRSALPVGTMPQVSTQLEVVSTGMESIQNRYVDGLREDDRRAAEAALLELEAQLEVAETLLASSLSETQATVTELIQESLAGIDRLLG